jgi:hypothetical protein
VSAIFAAKIVVIVAEKLTVIIAPTTIRSAIEKAARMDDRRKCVAHCLLQRNQTEQEDMIDHRPSAGAGRQSYQGAGSAIHENA